jgi:hypothetical protein
MTTRGWLRRLLLLVAIIVMPLQGMAMAATFVQCHEQAAAAQSATHDHSHDHDGGTSHHGPGDEGTPSGGMSAGQHLCGHFVLHAPASLNLAAQPRFAEWSASPAERYTVHFPDHPRRPPRG